MASLIQSVAAETPITPDEVKEQCHIDADDTSEDANIAVYIAAATAYAEKETGQSFVTRRLIWRADGFPRPRPSRYAQTRRDFGLFLPACPVLSGGIVSVSYVDSTGTALTLGSDAYRLIGAASASPRLEPAAMWPPAAHEAETVTVEFDAGYGAAADVPSNIRMALILLVAHWMANREPVVVGQAVTEVPFTVRALLPDPISRVL